MKKILVLSMLSIVTNLCTVYGVENMKSSSEYGYQQYERETLDSIQANGTVILQGTKVLDFVQVNGSLKAEESAINSLKVNGQADLINCVIANKTNINGSLNADNTKFKKELSVASQKIVLRMCTLESLIIREMIGYEGKQIIDLRSGTEITGSIIVESGNGEIWVSSNSKICESKVFGAQVYKK